MPETSARDTVASATAIPKLSVLHIFTMSFGFLGIQFGFALQNANTSRILRSFGADLHELPLFWLAAPIVGMIVQPVIGYYSDRTWNRLGRRKPFFLTGALLSAMALVLLPNSGNLAGIIPALWIGAGMVLVMDASFNIAMEPFRALVADNLPDSQRTLGFSIQTFLIGLGAVAGSALPAWLSGWNFSMEAGPDGIADNIKYAFYIGAAVFIVAILITVFFSREYPPEEYEKYHGRHDQPNRNIFADFANIPKTMKQMGVVQFFSWFALFSMWVYMTDAVATHIYGLSGDYSRSVEFNEAGNKVGEAFGVYNFVAMLYALCIPFVASKLGRKSTHAFSLIAGGLGLISVYFISDPSMMTYSMIGVGLAWASILSMPYVLISSSIPPGKLGVYMGIFNFFITMPQIVNGLLGGTIVKHVYGGRPVYAIVAAGIFLIIAAISVMFIHDPAESRLKSD